MGRARSDGRLLAGLRDSSRVRLMWRTLLACRDDFQVVTRSGGVPACKGDRCRQEWRHGTHECVRHILSTKQVSELRDSLHLIEVVDQPKDLLDAVGR